MPYQEADQFNTYLFHEGTAISAYEYMGAHAITHDGVSGYMYRVWAPRMRGISVGVANAMNQVLVPALQDGLNANVMIEGDMGKVFKAIQERNRSEKKKTGKYALQM